MNKIKVSKLLAGLSALFAFIMIFTNFGAALTCNISEGLGYMSGTPSIFNIMFGGFEGFNSSTTGMIRVVGAVGGLQVAFAFEIVATVFFVAVLVFNVLNKGDSKIAALLSFLGVAFILTSTILTFSTKAMTYNVIMDGLNYMSYGTVIIEKMKEIFANNMFLGSGVIVTGIFGILSLGTAIASRYILKHSNTTAQ